jgi:ribose transport system substrate-binding protein
MKKISVLVLVVAFALAIFAGCSAAAPASSEPAASAPASSAAVSAPASSEPAASAPASSAPAAGKKFKIGFSQKVLNAPFFVALADAVKKDVTDLGWDAVVLDAKQDIPTEAQNLESFIAQKCDFVFVNAIDPKAAVAPVNAVVEAGIPVIELDADIDPAAKVITTVQTNNIGSGRAVGLKIPSYYEANEKISAVLIDGNKGNTGGQARRTGLFQGIIEQRTGCTQEESLKLAQEFDQQLQSTGKAANEKANFEVVGQAYGNWNSDEGLKAAEDLLVAHPKVNCMLSENDGMLLGGLEAVKDAKLENQIKLFTSNDAQKEGLKAIIDGTAYKMTGENRPLKVAELGVKLAQDILVNGVDPTTIAKQTLLDPVAIDKDNASQFYDENAIF